jgi:hypothetical protein
LKETRPLWPPQRGVGLQEPNLGKTNPRVTLFICLRFVFHPLSRTHFFITNANPACSCVYTCKFQFRPIHPPLGDYQLASCTVSASGTHPKTSKSYISYLRSTPDPKSYISEMSNLRGSQRTLCSPAELGPGLRSQTSVGTAEANNRCTT